MPKCENFGFAFFKVINPIWVCASGTRKKIVYFEDLGWYSQFLFFKEHTKFTLKKGLLHLPKTKVHGLAEERLQGTDVRLQIPLQGLLHPPKAKLHGLAEDRLQGTDVRIQLPLQGLLHLPEVKVHGLAEYRLQGTDVRLQLLSRAYSTYLRPKYMAWPRTDSRELMSDSRAYSTYPRPKYMAWPSTDSK